jgi:hypothetical protein
MSENLEKPAAPEQGRKKLPYMPPAILHKERIEAMASACNGGGKGSGQQGCNFVSS